MEAADYVIDPKAIDVFDQLSKQWIDLVNRCGCRYYERFLPSEGASDRTLVHLTFPAWPTMKLIGATLESTKNIEADRIRDEIGRVLKYDRMFKRRLLD